MKNFNSFVLDFSVNIFNQIYKGRSVQCFWVLEVIVKAPSFSFLSVLHLQELLGLKPPLSNKLIKAHFYKAINDTEDLEEMELRNGKRFWVNRVLARHLVLFYYWGMFFITYYLHQMRTISI